MRAQPVELDEELFIELHPALRVRLKLNHPTLQTVGINLLIPRSVERIGEIDALAIAADLHHLRAAVQRLLGLARVSRPSHNATQMHRARLPLVNWVRNIVFDELPRSPARNIKEAIVERQVDVRYQRRYRLEALKEQRQFFRVSRLSGNFDHLADGPLALATVFPEPHPDGR